MTERRRYFAFDAEFFDGPLGEELFDRFGGAGVALFVAFLAACKRNLVPGQMNYGSDGDLLDRIGLPGLRLVNENGVEWDLDTFWTFLGRKKVVRRTRRGRLTNVTSTRWGKWQKDFTTQNEREGKRRSRAVSKGDTAPTGDGQSPDTNPTEKEIESVRERTKNDSVVLVREFPEVVHALTRQLAVGIQANGHKLPKAGTRAHTTWLDAMDKLLRIDEVDPEEVPFVIAWTVASDFWKPVMKSAASFRKQYSTLRGQRERDSKPRALPGGVSVPEMYRRAAEEARRMEDTA